MSSPWGHIRRILLVLLVGAVRTCFREFTEHRGTRLVTRAVLRAASELATPFAPQIDPCIPERGPPVPATVA